MIVLVGASASGKTEIAKILYMIHGYHKCITTTTRSKRAHEENDVDYHFLTPEQFNSIQNQCGFVESATYHGHHYGIQKKDVHIDGVVIVEPNGANTLIDALMDDVFVVYIHASEATRRKRMLSRGDQQTVVDERISFDRNVFDTKMMKRIDLSIENETESLENIATYIDQTYKNHLENQFSKKG